MKTLLLLTLSLMPALAQAGPLTDKAYQLAAELGSRETSLNPAQQQAVNRQLDALLASLSNQPAPSQSYLCVSRDNDNSRPYALAFKNFATLTRFPGAIYQTVEDCQQSLNAAQAIGDRLFACASRDNDGSRPFKILSLNGTASPLMLQRSILGSLEDCLAATRAIQVRPEGVLYCGSKDNDGTHPYSQTGYKYDGSFAQNIEAYPTLQDCNAAL